MTIAAILELINGCLMFSKEIFALIKMLKGTPEEHRQKIMLAAQAEADNFKKTGRPTWD
jgi:hypothetical protein